MTKHMLHALPDKALAYTDGACRGNGVADNAKGGFGAVIILPTGEQIDICGGESATTNNRMELMGAIAAVENSPADLPLQLWTDSGYVKNGITQWIHGWKKNSWRKADKKPVLNVELWQRLDTACQNRQIDWQWVKGHAGHDGNEYADKLANQGIDNLPKTFDKQVKFNKTAVKTATLNTDLTTTELDAKKKDPTIMNDISDMNLPPDFEPVDDYTDRDLHGEYDDMLLNVLDNVLDETPYTASTTPQPLTQRHDFSQADFSAFTDEEGIFVAQDDTLIAQRPAFNGITSQPNPTFVPLLPIAKNHGVNNRQLILDTETTGFDAQNGDRIIEVGIVELINRRFTGEKLHVYINPHKMMDEEVIKVHGIYNAFLDGMPNFEQIGQRLFEFLQGAELIAHNASFDMNFLQAEFSRMGLPNILEHVTVTDSLAIAKQLYAGQRNTLDALVKRLDVGKQDRTFHGALLDAEILAEVYLAMTGGQVSLAIDDGMGIGTSGTGEHARFDAPVARFYADSQAQSEHDAWLHSLAQKHPQLASNWGLTLPETANSH